MASMRMCASVRPAHCIPCAGPQVYEKKVSSLSNFNVENRGAVVSGGRVNALNTPRLSQPLHLPKVCFPAIRTRWRCMDKVHGACPMLSAGGI